MLERTITQIKDALERASVRITEGEELLALLEAAGEETAEVRQALVSAIARRDQWNSALALFRQNSQHPEG